MVIWQPCLAHEDVRQVHDVGEVSEVGELDEGLHLQLRTHIRDELDLIVLTGMGKVKHSPALQPGRFLSK